MVWDKHLNITNASGSSFAVSYPDVGVYAITVTSANLTATCNFTVVASTTSNMRSSESESKFSWKTVLLVFFGVGFFVLVVSIFIQTHVSTFQSFTSEVRASTISTSTPTGVGGSYEKLDQPVRLIIPTIGVDADIQSVGLAWQDNGQMGIPTNFTDVAWYKDGPLPGMPGNAVINGHLDGVDVEKAVFYDLGKLQIGDTVEVLDATGAKLQFRVVGSKSYDYQATTTEIFLGDASKSRLNLITCSGDWIQSEKAYDERIVVFTELVIQ